MHAVSIPVPGNNDKEAVESVKLTLNFIKKKGYLDGISSYEYALYDSKGKIIPVEE